MSTAYTDLKEQAWRANLDIEGLVERTWGNASAADIAGGRHGDQAQRGSVRSAFCGRHGGAVAGDGGGGGRSVSSLLGYSDPSGAVPGLAGHRGCRTYAFPVRGELGAG